MAGSAFSPVGWDGLTIAAFPEDIKQMRCIAQILTKSHQSLNKDGHGKDLCTEMGCLAVHALVWCRRPISPSC